jgi:hypothetical protein
MRSCIFALTALAFLAMQFLPAPACSSQEAQLPVFTLRYEGGVGVEEDEEEALAPASSRNRVTLRIMEEWSAAVTTNLYSAVSRKEYLDGPGSYSYFYLNPELAWKVNGNVTWRTGLRTKWVWYDDLLSSGESGDLTSLLARKEMTVKLPGGLRLAPSLQSVFDLHRDDEKTAQQYAAGVSLESRPGDAWRLNGRLRGILNLPLGAPSLVEDRVNYEFALSASWDPNR